MTFQPTLYPTSMRPVRTHMPFIVFLLLLLCVFCIYIIVILLIDIVLIYVWESVVEESKYKKILF